MQTPSIVGRGTRFVLASAVVAVGLSSVPVPSQAEVTIACVADKSGKVRFVESVSDCKGGETAKILGLGTVKFAFVTSQTYQGDISSPTCDPGAFDCTTGVGRADFECNRLAADAKWPGEYVAWLSDGFADAVDRMPNPGGPWFEVEGRHVAPSLEALTNTANIFLIFGAERTERQTNPSGSVWTGTDSDGMVIAGAHCDNWSNATNGFDGAVGGAGHRDETWTDNGVPASCNVSNHLYCFQK